MIKVPVHSYIPHILFSAMDCGIGYLFSNCILYMIYHIKVVYAATKDLKIESARKNYCQSHTRSKFVFRAFSDIKSLDQP